MRPSKPRANHRVLEPGPRRRNARPVGLGGRLDVSSCDADKRLAAREAAAALELVLAFGERRFGFGHFRADLCAVQFDQHRAPPDASAFLEADRGDRVRRLRGHLDGFVRHRGADRLDLDAERLPPGDGGDDRDARFAGRGRGARGEGDGRVAATAATEQQRREAHDREKKNGAAALQVSHERRIMSGPADRKYTAQKTTSWQGKTDMTIRLRLVAALLLAGVCGASAAADRPKVLLAVVSKGMPGVILFDAANDREHCRVAMEVAPHEAAFSRDGRQLVVPVYSSANIGQPGPDGQTINVVRTDDCRIEHAIDTGAIKRPHYVELGQRSGLFYVSAERDKSILVVDARRGTIVDSLPTGSDKTHFFALTRDERRIYTSNVSDNTLSVLDVQGREVLEMVNAGSSNQRMTLSPDGRWFVTSLWQAGKVALFRTADNALDFEVPVDGAPFVARFSPDGRTLYNMGMPPRGAGPGGIRVWRIDIASRQVATASTEDLGSGTGGLQINPLNGQLYLTAYSGKVSVLDPVTLKLLRQFDGGDTPDGLFFSRR